MVYDQEQVFVTEVCGWLRQYPIFDLDGQRGSKERTVMIQCKRAYVAAAQDDGYRVLVDRLWPRNCRKDFLQLGAWLPDAAPSTQLRKDFKSGKIDFVQFSTAYRLELAASPQNWLELLAFAERGTLTLIFSAKDPQLNNAVVLAQWLEAELDRHAGPSSPVCYLGDFPDD